MNKLQKEVVEELKNMKKELGINSNLNKDGSSWHLRILNHLNMIKFKDRIGFSEGYRKQLI